MSHRSPHAKNLDYYAVTLQAFISQMKEEKLLLWGKFTATICLTAMVLLGHGNANILGPSIAAMWVITIPSIVDAWIIAKNRQNKRPKDP